MKDAVGEHIVVHKLQVFLWPDLFQRLAQLLSTFGSEIGAHLANDCIHRVVHRTGIDGKPGNFTLQHPVDKLACRARMLDEIAGFVWF